MNKDRFYLESIRDGLERIECNSRPLLDAIRMLEARSAVTP